MSQSTKSSLNDLNEYLFERLDALSNEDLSDKEFDQELKRAKAITDVSKTVIENAKVMLDARKHADEFGYGVKERKMPKVLDYHEEK
ncbi:hypothetical protein [Erysipelothrix anatis]|uniref:hypothetical protein n=1 Tax=Erysipelothrix anatis TaxID=2683713 RepID=UPI00135BB045|nr:hypothetical protein [Erysipelothrix anatis]